MSRPDKLRTPAVALASIALAGRACRATRSAYAWRPLRLRLPDLGHRCCSAIACRCGTSSSSSASPVATGTGSVAATPGARRLRRKELQPLSPRQAQAREEQLGARRGQCAWQRPAPAVDLVWFALAIMALASMALGWVLAGRALRPSAGDHLRGPRALRLQSASAPALDGPNDELRELGDTFDDLLGRLESSFEAQRQFVANASHELRTPLTLERAILEVTLADPAASAASLRAACERVLAIGEQQEQMIDALLTFARSERGLRAPRATLARDLDRQGSSRPP